MIDENNPTKRPPIELPSVISLDVRLPGSSFGALLFLEFPAVETLTIIGRTEYIIEAFTRHPRLYPVVRSFSLVNPGSYSVERDILLVTILDFISMFPNVRDVAFRRADPNPILRALHERHSTSEMPWPHLSAVTITVEDAKVAYKKQTWANIVKFVGNRLQLGHPILFMQLSSQIVERGTPRQQQRLREQVALTEC
jgi:hypothetical protein